MHTYLPSLTGLPPSHPPHPTPLGGHGALSWAPCVIQQLPTSSLFYRWMEKDVVHIHSGILVVAAVQSLSHVWLFVTPWTAARQASLSCTNTRSLLKRMSIEWVMPSNGLILCRPFLLPPSIFPSIRVFSSESVLLITWPKFWSFSISPKNIQN